MQQHPIPQNISTYQFRLIGDMTIKQFIMLSIGLGIAILIWFTNLFFVIKAVLVILACITGFAIAFMPYEERTLDQWLLAYIRAIYAPTHFIWLKSPRIPEYFNFTSTTKAQPVDYQQLAEAARFRKEQGLSSFLMTLPEGSTLSKLEQGEKSQLAQISQLFLTPVNPISPDPSNIVTTQYQINAVDPDASTPSIINTPAPTKIGTSANAGPRTTTANPLPTTHIRETSPQETKSRGTAHTQGIAQPYNTTIATKTANQTIAATTSTNLPFPSTPTTPNTIVGMVLSNEGKILENAIIEIRDQTGIPVRATKSNRLGQFFSTTPLRNGEYEIEIEKDDYTFAIIKLELTGQIVHPLKIQATSEV